MNGKKLRKTAQWRTTAPLERTTLDALIAEIAVVRPDWPTRRALLVRTGAIEKVIDNEADGLETLQRLRRERQRRDYER